VPTGVEEQGEILCMAIFLCGFIVVALWETYKPRAVLAHPLGARWFHNIALYLVSLVLFTVVARAVASLALSFNLNTGISLSRLIDRDPVPGFLIGILLVDFVRYASHVVHHRVPWLWRFHSVHHADGDVDVTTTLRHHPVEGLSMWVLTTAAYGLLDVPIIVIVAFEVVATAFASVQHANIRLPALLERLLLPVFCTPDMHRIHHSIEVAEGNSNYGVVLSLWDRLFGTYTELSAKAHDRLVVGLRDYADFAPQKLSTLLFAPFVIGKRPPNPASQVTSGQP
jgi:sterol desaturase/sphingolipid hydroxylase (fatty acid hydroxylase superfamily)